MNNDSHKQEALQDICHLMSQNSICEGVACRLCPLCSVATYEQTLELLAKAKEEE